MSKHRPVKHLMKWLVAMNGHTLRYTLVPGASNITLILGFLTKKESGPAVDIVIF